MPQEFVFITQTWPWETLDQQEHKRNLGQLHFCMDLGPGAVALLATSHSLDGLECDNLTLTKHTRKKTLSKTYSIRGSIYMPVVYELAPRTAPWAQHTPGN